MKNEIAYLKDGRKVQYNQKISDKYLVQVLYTYCDEYGIEYEDIGSEIVVDKVFSKPPVEVFHEEIKNFEARKETLVKEIQKLSSEKSSLSHYISQNTKFKDHIINKKEFMNAKSIAFFTKDRLLPTTMDKNRLYGLKISLSISIFQNQERAWGYSLIEDQTPYSSFIPDVNQDILIDKTQEEIDKITKERIGKIENPNDYHSNQWIAIDEKYLTDDLKKYKMRVAKNQKDDKIAEKQEQLEKLKMQLSALLNSR